MINFKPLHDNVLILPIEEEISSTLVIPDNIKKSAKYAKVLAKGPEVKDVEINDIVLLPDYGAIEVIIDGIPYKLVHGGDISAILS